MTGHQQSSSHHQSQRAITSTAAATIIPTSRLFLVSLLSVLLVASFATSFTVQHQASFGFSSLLSPAGAAFLKRTRNTRNTPTPRCHPSSNNISTSRIIIMQSTSSTEESSSSSALPDPSSMRIAEIKNELTSMGVSFTDCFDKESLVDKLKIARSSGAAETSSEASRCTTATSTTEKEPSSSTSGPSSSSSTTKTTTTPEGLNNKEQILKELRSLRVKELRTQCAQANIRWAQMIEKEELVQALYQNKLKSLTFSPSGALTPGKVTDITSEDILVKETTPGAATTPLLIDVYATWCGPCQLMAPQLEEASVVFGDTVRVIKMDSDKYPEWAGRWKVGGLPTLIVLDGSSGRELQRVEGALMKDDLIKLGRSHV